MPLALPTSYSVQMCGCVRAEIVRASRSKRSRNCVSGEVGRQNLDRHRPVESRVARAPHFSHAAGANARDDLVRAEPLSRCY